MNNSYGGASVFYDEEPYIHPGASIAEGQSIDYHERMKFMKTAEFDFGESEIGQDTANLIHDISEVELQALDKKNKDDTVLKITHPNVKVKISFSNIVEPQDISKILMGVENHINQILPRDLTDALPPTQYTVMEDNDEYLYHRNILN